MMTIRIYSSLLLLLPVLQYATGEETTTLMPPEVRQFRRIELKIVKGFSNYLDTSSPGDGYLPDLFVSVNYSAILSGGKFDSEQIFGETSVVYEDQDPKWDQTLTFDRRQPTHDFPILYNGVLHVSLLDKQVPDNTFLGEFTIDLREIERINGTVVKQDIIYLNRPTVQSFVTYQLTAFLDDEVPVPTETESTSSSEPAVTEIMTADGTVTAIVADPVTHDYITTPDAVSTTVNSS